MSYRDTCQFPSIRAAIAVAVATLAAHSAPAQSLFDNSRVDHPLSAQPDESVTADFNGTGRLTWRS